MCEEDGITLIVIPYWWNTSIESLSQTIHLARPDLEMPVTNGNPIVNVMPNSKSTKEIYISKVTL